jgi:hypothetical protein
MAKIGLASPRAPGEVALVVVRARVALDQVHTTHVRSERSGTVKSVAVVAGGRVASGDELLVIDRDVGGGKAALAAAARLTAASHARARMEELWKVHAASTGDRERAVADHERAVRALLDARRASRTATVRVSPLAGQDGEVVRVLMHPGDRVLGAEDDPSFPTELLVVADSGHVTAVADDVPRGVRAGAHGSFLGNATPDAAFDCAAETSDEDPMLRCPFADPTHRVLPGMNGLLSLTVSDALGLAIPRAALVNGGAEVLVRRGNAPDGGARFVMAKVSVAFDGGPDAAFVTVTGLAADDVVVADASQLR